MCSRRAALPQKGGDRSAVVLGALHRHRRLPVAAALLGVLLYSALVASHVVSQATSLTAEPMAAQNSVHAAADALPSCHEPEAAADKADESDRGVPASPQKKCPFCAGYAALHISILAGSSFVVSVEAPARPRAIAGAQLVHTAGSHSWQPRGPPAA